MQSLSSSNQPSRIFALDKDIHPPEYILKTDVCTIGRSNMCEIVVARKIVSRLHAKIEREGPRYFLHDANSANGTFVNGQRISEAHLLKGDDMIGLGTTKAQLRFDDPDPTAPLMPRLHYDEQTMGFFFDEQPMSLTPSELRLLLYLYQHVGDICTRENCAAAIWQRPYDHRLDADALDRVLSNLRRKLRQIDPDTDVIKTHRSVGYELAL
jgi:DNA-binding response OmpR family regulator